MSEHPPPIGPGPVTPTDRHWFEPLADHLGAAYLRYSFTKGTANEVAFLTDALELVPGMRLLDIGCGPGRHANAFAAQGLEVVGLDVSERFVELARRDAPDGATFVCGDAREITFDSEFDAVISLCQGAFGLTRSGTRPEPTAGFVPLPDPDEQILAGIGRALRPGGRLALSAFSAYFQVRWLEDSDTFDASMGLNHERTTLLDEDGQSIEADLWTTCYTPRELRLLSERVGLEVVDVWSVTPGQYRADPPDLDHPEFLLVARRP